MKIIEFVTLPDNVQPEPSNFAPAGTANERRGQTTDGASGGSGNSWRHHQPTAAGPQRHQHRQPAGRKCWFVHRKNTQVYIASKTKAQYIFSTFHSSHLYTYLNRNCSFVFHRFNCVCRILPSFFSTDRPRFPHGFPHNFPPAGLD